MTHILMISRCPPWPLHLGDRLIVYHLARELQKMGVQVDLLALAQTPSDWSLGEQQHYNHFFGEMTLFDEKPRPLSEVGRRVLMPSARFPTEAAHSFSPELWREVERWIARTDYDAVHLFGGVQVYDLEGCLNGLKTVITPYESYALYLDRKIRGGEAATLREGVVNRALRWAARRYESWMYAPYDVVTVLSEPDRDMLRSLNADYDVRVVPNGIEMERFQRVNDDRAPAQLLFVGNYEYAPNLDAALWLINEMFPLVKQQVPDAKLWLVGNAPPPELTALASDAIEVTGRVPDVRTYLDQATVFVCPLRYGAGIKNKVLEALASGCPLVATPVSIDGITVTDGDSALVAEDAEGLAAATVRVLRDSALQGALREKGHAVIESGYTWRSVAERYAALYEG
jgi:glycosyltransferase involved in cell wall biosynthesis